MSNRYKDLGASADKVGLHAVLASVGVSGGHRYFAGLSPDTAGNPDFASFIHCDGAGTKSIVAYLLHRETGDPGVYAGLAQDALVMNLDDILCVGLPDHLLIGNLIGRNARLVGDEALHAIIGEYKQLASQLQSLGIPIELGGGETADLGDIVRTLLVDAVMTGRIAKRNIIDPANITLGDVIVGLSSTGIANYEENANSGIGSNGLTLARHALLKHDYVARYPEIVDPGLNLGVCYQGPFSVTDSPKGLGMSVGRALLSPTRTYAPVLYKIFENLPQAVHALIHVTGGGLSKVLRFGGPGLLYVKDSLFPTPPLFSLIQQQGRVSWSEMHQVFNMGQRMEIYLPQDAVLGAIDIAKSFGIEARVIGRVEKNSSAAEKNRVRVENPHGVFEYEV